MTNLRITITIFSVIAMQTSIAQEFGGGVNFHGGVTFQHIGVTGTLTYEYQDYLGVPIETRSADIGEVRNLFGMSLAGNVSIFKFTDDFSIGNTTQIDLGGWGQLETFFWYTNVPIYFTIRYGANATKQSTRKFGIGIGIGLQFSFNYLDGVNFAYPSTNWKSEYCCAFPPYILAKFHPALMVDLYYVLNKGKSIGLKFNYLIGKAFDSKGTGLTNSEYWENYGFSAYLQF